VVLSERSEATTPHFDAVTKCTLGCLIILYPLEVLQEVPVIKIQKMKTMLAELKKKKKKNPKG
jgi:hypothetical protein